MHQLPEAEFVTTWNGANSLAEVVERVSERVGQRLPRWAVLACAVAARKTGIELKTLPDEAPSPDTIARTRELVGRLMADYGLSDWQFGFNTNLRRAGVCKYPARGQPGRIELSRHYVASNPEAEVRDTILHEIAHALVGPGHGHDAVWKRKCLEIGARPERCYGESVRMPKGRWRATCGGCRKEYDRHRRPARVSGWFCKACGKDRGSLMWQDAG